DNESTALARREPEQAITVRKPYNPHDVTPLFRAIWDLFKWIGRKLFGETAPATANNQHLLAAGDQTANQSYYFAPEYQTGIFAQPDYWTNDINGLNSPQLQFQWNDPAICGNNAQQVYGNNLIPCEPDY